jgi:N-hydroxyarylamine O-acetyltransferase
MQIDLAAYLARIGIEAPARADAAGLAAVHRAHRLAIPFENLDVILGRGVSLDPEAVFDKLVTRRRGGYCFEQNQLFGRALAALGFTVRPLLARVWLAGPDPMPGLTHTLLLVTIEGVDWIADAGFGGSFVPPMPLAEGEAVTADGARHRLRRDAERGWMLARLGESDADEVAEAWADQYSLTLDAVHPIDLAIGNHWTSTAPDTRFVVMRLASLPTATGFLALTERRFSARDVGGAEQFDVEDAGAYRALLAERFGLALSVEEVEGLGLF